MADTVSKLVLSDLPNRKPTRFTFEPSAAVLAGLKAEFDLLDLTKLRLSGEIAPAGSTDWRLMAQLGATVTQTCVVTLDPVRTRLEEQVERFYTNNTPDLDISDEIEMPDDDTIESVPAVLDLAALATEALALALPQYPRAADAALDETNFTEPGKQAMRDEDTRPFAGLAGLRDQLQDKNPSDET
ncbi:YceD family protein [Algirhabdus cladophorae]|uniref:YceD family protein n=1 Tax=Algirhabdus cladophorae TaxID=3377108 RepID=UPI003B84B648